MQMMRPLVAALLFSMALAGCAGDPGSGGPGNGLSDQELKDNVDDLDLSATSTTGVIRGVVVDPAVTPVVGADVAVKVGDKTQTAKTTAGGAFGFANLPPGTYFVKVTKAGFSPAQQSVEVVAGVSDPPIMKVLVEPDTTFVKPYYQAYVFKGFIECSTTTAAPGVVGLGFAACSAINDYAGTNVTNDNPAVQYPLAQVPTYAQSEMVWEPTQALGNSLSLAWSRDCGDANAGFLCDYEVEGPSPLVLRAPGAELEEITLQEAEETNVLYIRVFNVAPPETQGTVGLTFEQSFTVYTHLFYGYSPPESWQFSRDGDFKPPQ